MAKALHSVQDASAPRPHCEVLTVQDTAAVEKRHAGCGVVVGSKLYLWGGETSEKYEVTLDNEDEEEEEGEEDEEEEEIPQRELSRPVNLPKPPNHPFDVFDLTDLTWSAEDTGGEVPDLGIGSILSYHKGTHSMYLYGGWNNMKSRFDAKFCTDVYCVSMDTWNWEQIVVPEGAIKPSPRYLTGMVVHGDRLCNFGGVGPDIVKVKIQGGDGVENQDVGADYHGYEDKGVLHNYGWNSEYYEFNVIERKWEAPMSRTGAMRPQAVGAHVFAKFDSHRAVLFGGRTRDGRKDDTWIFDLDKREFEGPLNMTMKPKHRVFSTLCPLIDPEVVGWSLCPGGPPVQQKLLLLWGKEHLELIIPDCWLFDGQTMTWNKMELGEIGRYWHIACSYFSGSGKSTHGQVVIYGGAKHDTSAEAVQFCGLRGLTIISFGIKSLKKLCLSVIVSALGGVPNLHQFPDYVPTTSKQEVLDSYVAHAHTTAHDIIR